MNETPRWLTPEEKSTWGSFVRMQEKLIGRLSRQMQTDTSLSAADFIVLANLTEVPEGRVRFLELTRMVEWEKSRMSHQITRMAKRGIVVKEECPGDGRGAFIAVTPAGREAIEAAAPLHVATVRRLFLDALTPEELSELARISNRVLERMEKEPY